MTFGDKSWGSIKLGKDIGIFASNAILNDMTLLGVGSSAIGSVSGSSTTLGGIGTGYIYAAWKGQVAYTTPNMNGFQATIGLTNPNQAVDSTGVTSAINTLNQERFGIEGQANYSFSADALNGKVWVGGVSNKVKTTSAIEYTATAADIGANLNAGAIGLTGYYYKGEGAGTTTFLGNGASTTGGKRDSDGGYLQATYKIGSTKLGVAYGISKLDLASGEAASTLVKENERTTVGVYHALTKHLNLVSEYNHVQATSHLNAKNTSDTVSLGAILFF
jgi:predicted porin